MRVVEQSGGGGGEQHLLNELFHTCTRHDTYACVIGKMCCDVVMHHLLLLFISLLSFAWAGDVALPREGVLVTDADGKTYQASAIHLLSLKTLVTSLVSGATTVNKPEVVAQFQYRIAFDVTDTTVDDVTGNGSFPITHIDAYYLGSGPNDIGAYRFLVTSTAGTQFESVKYLSHQCDAIQALLLYKVIKSPAK